MSLNNRVTDRQSDTHPRTLRRDKRLESFSRTPMRQSSSGIRYTDLDDASLQTLAVMTTSRRSLNCIAGQIKEHLLDLYSIDQQRREARINARADNSALFFHISCQKGDYLLDGHGKICGNPLDLSFGRKPAKAVYDLPGPDELIGSFLQWQIKRFCAPTVEQPRDN
jgi:hypothetical protein